MRAMVVSAGKGSRRWTRLSISATTAESISRLIRVELLALRADRTGLSQPTAIKDKDQPEGRGSMNAIEEQFHKAFFDYAKKEKQIKNLDFTCRIKTGSKSWGTVVAIIIDGEGFTNPPYKGYIYLMPQYQIGRYFVDFLAIMVIDDDEYRDSIAVEIDGHDFHEKTKEQAAHDKKRDRKIVAENHGILRFTGSEAFHDAYKCVEEVIFSFAQRFTLS
jgi:very-short-patch-repair endonuclease